MKSALIILEVPGAVVLRNFQPIVPTAAERAARPEGEAVVTRMRADEATNGANA